VQLGTALKGFDESDLEPLPLNADPWEDALRGVFAGSRAFRSRLTVKRLEKPPSRIVASFGSARAAFYPYQFKPLLKFLENPQQRLLIADDVGLGKTIEAGYILREMRARANLERVLVLVPSRLQSKWKSELHRRFDEQFDVVRRGDFLRLGERLQRGHEVEDFRWITSIEGLRDEAVIGVLNSFSPGFDLVIVDEAHRLRNPATLQYKLGAALSSSADALLFLTATPLQTGLKNLFTLLSLLDPNEFADETTFNDQYIANRPVIALANAVRSAAPSETRALLLEISRHPLNKRIVETEYFDSIRARCQHVDTLTREERVELQRDISELGLFSHVVTRTRKADVFRDRPRRNASAPVVRLTPAEMAFYASVADLCRQMRPDLSNWGLAMTTLMAYRFTASCIPAAIEAFKEHLASNAGLREEVDEDIYEDQPWTTPASVQQALASIADAATITTDTKFDVFRAALGGLWNDDRAAGRLDRKIIVFSFFKRTLRYLSRRLQEMAVDHRRIDGGVAIADRELILEEFEADSRIKILLSSEVGSEGLDLQFASVVVNYDLPWNPMVLEQRIGRVDRIGQKSATITIINLVADGTVEQRILLRLYERIRLFEETIGDIDPILGKQIDELTMQALRGELSAEEQVRRTEETADVIQQEQLAARHLGTESEALFAADQAFLDEIQSLSGKRRIPSPLDLFRLVQDYLIRNHPGCEFPDSVLELVTETSLTADVSAAIRRLEADADATRFARKIEGGRFLATFNQDAALTHPRAELIHARHPLVVLSRSAMAKDIAPCFAISLPAIDGVPAGAYIFSLYLFDVDGVRARSEIVPCFVSVSTRELVSQEIADQLMIEMLDNGRSSDPPPDINANTIEAAINLLAAAADHTHQLLKIREGAVDEARATRRASTLEGTLMNRVRKAEQRLRTFTENRAGEFAIRMARGKLEKERTGLVERMNSLRTRAPLNVGYEEIAVGVLNIL
jgi:superfamily II DNA or RNA helicase